MAQTMARPTPVLPEVASTTVPPGLRRPSRSAASMILSAIRSLMDPPGLKNYTMAVRVQRSPRPMWFNRTNGVLPMVPRMLSWISGAAGSVDEEAMRYFTYGGQWSGVRLPQIKLMPK